MFPRRRTKALLSHALLSCPKTTILGNSCGCCGSGLPKKNTCLISSGLSHTVAVQEHSTLMLVWKTRSAKKERQVVSVLTNGAHHTRGGGGIYQVGVPPTNNFQCWYKGEIILYLSIRAKQTRRCFRSPFFFITLSKNSIDRTFRKNQLFYCFPQKQNQPQEEEGEIHRVDAVEHFLHWSPLCYKSLCFSTEVDSLFGTLYFEILYWLLVWRGTQEILLKTTRTWNIKKLPFLRWYHAAINHCAFQRRWAAPFEIFW